MAGMNREVRVGVTQGYVVFFHEMGTKWVGKHLSAIIVHVLDLVANPKATPSHIDAGMGAFIALFFGLSYYIRRVGDVVGVEDARLNHNELILPIFLW